MVTAKRYFETVYPARGSIAGRWLSRHGESARAAIVRQWLGSTTGASILDAGCGDGTFLLSVLQGRPAQILCEDLSLPATSSASRTLAGSADRVTVVAADALQNSAQKFDVVLAIGLLDYQNDWRRALQQLAARSRGVLIVSVPRCDRPRNWLRRLWFAPLGIRLQWATRKDVEAFEVRRTPYDWMIRIRK